MASAGQNAMHAWQPTQPRPMKYILVPLAALASAVFTPTIEPAALKNNGDAMAVELNIMNFLLVKFKLFSVISLSPLKKNFANAGYQPRNALKRGIP
jgi:hypothetical protein